MKKNCIFLVPMCSLHEFNTVADPGFHEEQAADEPIRDLLLIRTWRSYDRSVHS